MRLHHLALRTRDPDALAAFYRDVVGLRELRRQADGAGEVRSVWLDAPPAVLMIEREGAGEPGVPAGTMELVAFAIERDELAGLRARLARASVAIEAETAFTVYFRDPDGRRVGASHYRFG